MAQFAEKSHSFLNVQALSKPDFKPKPKPNPNVSENSIRSWK
jgi:hypothetical protein